MLVKNKKKWSFFGLIVLLAFSLFACSDEERLRDLHNYIDSLKKTITRHQRTNVLENIHFPAAVSFQANEKYRDPFENEEASYDGGEITNPLTAFPIKSFEFVGTLMRNKQTWAVIQAPDHKIYQVTINDRIGNHYGRIVDIDSGQIKVEEEVSPQETGAAGQGAIKQIVTLQLKGED